MENPEGPLVYGNVFGSVRREKPPVWAKIINWSLFLAAAVCLWVWSKGLLPFGLPSKTLVVPAGAALYWLYRRLTRVDL